MVERKSIGQSPPQKERKHSKIEEEDIASTPFCHHISICFRLCNCAEIDSKCPATLPSLLLLVKRCSCLLRRSITLSQSQYAPRPLQTRVTACSKVLQRHSLICNHVMCSLIFTTNQPTHNPSYKFLMSTTN